MKTEAGERYALYGAAIYVVGVVQFFMGIFVTASRYGPPSYSPLVDTISDLQAVNCGIFQGIEVCSPLHVIANSSVAVLGLSLVLGSLLIRPAFPASGRRSAAIGLLVAAGMATLANAFTPEDVTLMGDVITALVAFLGANFGLIQIGRVMSEDSVWGYFRFFTTALGIVGLAGLILDGAGLAGPLGTGGNEWLIVAPILVWAFVVGILLLGPKRPLRPAPREETDRRQPVWREVSRA